MYSLSGDDRRRVWLHGSMWGTLAQLCSRGSSGLFRALSFLSVGGLMNVSGHVGRCDRRKPIYLFNVRADQEINSGFSQVDVKKYF